MCAIISKATTEDASTYQRDKSDTFCDKYAESCAVSLNFTMQHKGDIIVPDSFIS
jgi:hypothetical protein